MKRLFYISYAALLTAPTFVFAQASLITFGDTLKTVVGRLIGLMNALVWPLVGLCIVFFFYGLIKYIRDASTKGHGLGRQQIIWSLIGLFVVFSIWGLINFIAVALLGSMPGNPMTNYYQPGQSFAPTGSFKSADFQETGGFRETGGFQETGSFQPN